MGSGGAEEEGEVRWIKLIFFHFSFFWWRALLSFFSLVALQCPMDW